MASEVGELIEANEALLRLVKSTEGFHSDHPLAKEALLMRLSLTMASVYIGDYVKNRINGADDVDAIIAVLKGETKISPEAQQAWQDAMRQQTH